MSKGVNEASRNPEHTPHLVRAAAIATIFAMGFQFPLRNACGQTNFLLLKAFSSQPATGTHPSSTLIVGSDGALYGTTYDGSYYQHGTVFKLNTNGTGYTDLHRFTGANGDGGMAMAGVVEGSDGILYGTTYSGGASNLGTIYSLNKDGNDYRVLYSFGGLDGKNPRTVLTAARGTLYGTTYSGGASNLGTVFKLNSDGSAYKVLHDFTGPDGSHPQGGMVAASDGLLYGTTYSGGASNMGTLFGLNKDGSGYLVLRSFGAFDGDGTSPAGDLIEASDGTIYGTASLGGAGNLGTIFKLSKDGGQYTVLRSLSNADGTKPQAGLAPGIDGALYGTTSGGGSNYGTVFKVNTDGTGYSVVHSWRAVDGRFPRAGLVRTGDGALYGTVYQGGPVSDVGSVFRLNPDGSGYTNLFYFNAADGIKPNGLAVGSDGVLYGTTPLGGSGGSGIVFKLTKDGNGYTLIHSFLNVFPFKEGDRPQGGVVEGNAGVLYGATSQGGSNNLGTVFRLNKDGSGLSVLRHFTGAGGDGSGPAAGLLLGSDGVLYGSTRNGGLNGAGTVFKLNQDGTEYAVLHMFLGTNGDGRSPVSQLIEASDGALYGTTLNGGFQDWGTVFKVNRDGAGYSTLLQLNANGTDGGHPWSGLLEGSDGALYGTGMTDSVNDGGLIFRLNRDGSGYANLHAFTSANGDGKNPITGLLESRSGVLYGTTQTGWTNSGGMVFRMNKDGSGFAPVHIFPYNGTNGWQPIGLLQDADETLFGFTFGGSGSIFKLFSSPERITIIRIQLTGIGALLDFSNGVPSRTYQIQATSNLKAANNWLPIGSLTVNTNGSSQFLDTNALTHSTRFYRGAAL
jgi:uncharacterized repeat protein (TIGR03803 family)